MDHSKSSGHKIKRFARVSVLIVLFCVSTPFIAFADISLSVSITAIVPSNFPPPSNTGNGGGGGGGGSGANSPELPIPGNGVTFRGLAYPGSKVSLLQDSRIVAEQSASPDGSFEISLSGVGTGTYNFGVRGEDKQGRKSPLQLYTVFVSSGVTTLIKGIFLPPTISLDKSEVKKGDVLTIIGQSVPQAEVTVLTHSSTTIERKTTADASGVWLYKLDTSKLEYGSHDTSARAKTDNDITQFSPSMTFIVSDTNKTLATISVDSVHDVNHDGKIDIIDFSIMAYWFHRVHPPKAIDFNNDGKIDLIDFSILAYYWTG